MDAADLARIRFVTSRYGELQGLRQLVVLGACLIAFWSRPYVRLLRYLGPVEAMVGLVASLLPFVIVLSARPFLDRYYARRFGSVGGGGRPSIDAIGWVVLIFVAFSVDARTLGAAKPSAILIAGALIALHIVMRDWPWRRHHVITLILCAVGAWMTAAFPALRGDDLRDLVQKPLTMLICAQIVGTYLDHRLLVQSLGSNRHVEADERRSEHADPI
jgi:hypothetical protein